MSNPDNPIDVKLTVTRWQYRQLMSMVHERVRKVQRSLNRNKTMLEISPPMAEQLNIYISQDEWRLERLTGLMDNILTRGREFGFVEEDGDE